MVLAGLNESSPKTCPTWDTQLRLARLIYVSDLLLLCVLPLLSLSLSLLKQSVPLRSSVSSAAFKGAWDWGFCESQFSFNLRSSQTGAVTQASRAVSQFNSGGSHVINMTVPTARLQVGCVDRRKNVVSSRSVAIKELDCNNCGTWKTVAWTTKSCESNLNNSSLNRKLNRNMQ